MTRSPRKPTAGPLPPNPPAIPPIGLGCAGLGNLYAPVGEEDAIATLQRARDLGVRYFDTAPYYGHGLSEARLGRFLARAGRDGALVSSKVGRGLRASPGGPSHDTGFVEAAPFEPFFDYSRDGVLRQVDESLKRLGGDRLDIAFVHDIGRLTHGDDHQARFREALDGAFPALCSLRDQGVVGAIGIGVNEVEVCLETLRHVDLDVILLAGRYTLLDQSAGPELLPMCLARGVRVIVGGPYNSGVLAGGEHFDYAPASGPIRRKVEGLRQVCEAYGVSLAAAALRFPFEDPAVISVIPGARTAAEIDANIANFYSRPPDCLWRALRAEGLIVGGWE